MKRLILVCAIALSCLDDPQVRVPSSPASAVQVVPATTLPNVVIILTDDMRADLLATMPNVQRYLVDSGVTFRKAFANTALCCPSRASLLTGQQQHDHRVFGNVAPAGGALAFQDATTLATDLHALGYTTALMGKYLNQYVKLAPNYVPPGWDEWRAFQQEHYQGVVLVEKAWNSPTVTTTTYSGYSTGLLRARAAAFLSTAPASAPVFLLVAPYAPHFEVSPPGFPVAASQDVGACAAVPMPPFSSAFNEADVSDKPLFVRKKPAMSAALRARADTSRRKMCEALRSVDRLVGDIVASLGATGRLSNTFVIFTTDNGYLLGEHRLVERKAVIYDEATRIPFVIRGPRARLQAVDSNLVQMIDITATIRAAVGLAPGTAGRDLRPTLATGAWTTDAILMEHRNAPKPEEESDGALRTHDYLYAEYPAAGTGGAPFVELYDLRLDPDQMVNVAGQPAYAPIVAQLHARLVQLRGF